MLGALLVYNVQLLSCWRDCLYVLCTILSKLVAGGTAYMCCVQYFSCGRINRLPIINHHQPVRLASLQHPLGFSVTCNL